MDGDGIFREITASFSKVSVVVVVASGALLLRVELGMEFLDRLILLDLIVEAHLALSAAKLFLPLF